MFTARYELGLLTFGFHKGDRCLLRGTNWVFKHSVFIKETCLLRGTNWVFKYSVFLKETCLLRGTNWVFTYLVFLKETYARYELGL